MERTRRGAVDLGNSRRADAERAMADMLARKPLLPAELAAAAATVCVTGATSYIGANVVARLLAAGHTVRACDLQTPRTAAVREWLDLLPGADERLAWFHGDMREPACFDEALKGCKYVIHTACPVDHSMAQKRAFEHMISPAVVGTQHLLEAATKAGTVEKVVMCSTTSAALNTNSPPGHVFSEADWNLEWAKFGAPYDTAKTVSEMQAWALSQQQSNWKLVTICPGAFLGPPVVPNKETLGVVFTKQAIMDGSQYPFAPPLAWHYIDIDDVAAAHTLAMVLPQAKGRYLLAERGETLAAVAAILRKNFPHHRIPYKTLPNWLFTAILRLGAWTTGDGGILSLHLAEHHKFKLDCSKAQRELGLEFIPLEKSAVDMMERLIEHEMVPPAPANSTASSAAESAEKKQD